MCNKRGKRVKLEIHHIIKWSSASSLRYDPENGICLCRSCHKSITGKESHYITYFTEKIRSNKK